MADTGRPTISELDELSDAAVHDYLVRGNKTALENMIGLCLHVMSPDELADFLEWQATDLRELDKR